MSTQDFSEKPNNINAEESVLSTLITQPQRMIEDKDFLSIGLEPKHFYLQKHAWLYEAIQDIVQQIGYNSITPITIADELQKRDRLDGVGGFGEILALSTVASPIDHYSLTEHASIVYDLYHNRSAIELSSAVAKIGYDYANRGRVHDLINKAWIDFMNTQGGNRTDDTAASALSLAYNKFVSKVRTGGQVVTGLDIGIPDIINMFGGVQPTDLIYLAGRPGMGKTSLALSIFTNLLLAGKNVGFFSNEMTPEALANGILAKASGVATKKILNGVGVTDNEFLAVTQAHDRMAGTITKRDMLNNPIEITYETANGGRSFITSASPYVHQVTTRCKLEHMMYGLDLVFVDYIQIMKILGRFSNRQAEVSAISGELKRLTLELNVPVIALAQLSRAVEGRDDKRPVMADLRESGSLEQDADVIMFVYRDEVYNPETEYPHIAEIIVPKVRFGRSGSFGMLWQSHTQAFKPLQLRTAP